MGTHSERLAAAYATALRIEARLAEYNVHPGSAPYRLEAEVRLGAGLQTGDPLAGYVALVMLRREREIDEARMFPRDLVAAAVTSDVKPLFKDG